MRIFKLILPLLLFFFSSFSPALAASLAPALTEAGNLVDSDPQQALTRLLPLIEQARALSDNKSEVIALRQAGNAYHRSGDQEQAAFFLQESANVARKHGFLKEEGAALNSLGIYCFDIGMYEQSLRYFLQALDARNLSSDSLGTARTTNNLGLVQNKIGNYDQALEYFQQSLSIKEAANEIDGQVITLNNMGLAYKGKGDLTQAISLYQQALQLAKKTTFPEGKGYTHQNLGEAYRRLGFLQRSLEECHQALREYRSVQFLPRLSYTAYETGRTYQALNDHEAANAFYQEAFELAERQNQRELLRDLNRQLALLSEEQGDAKTALNYYKNYLALNDELALSFNREKIMILDAENNSSRQKAEISLLKHEAELNVTRLQNQYLAVFALSVILLFTACSIFHFRRQIRLRKAKELELQQVTHELQAANERLNLLANTDSLTRLANRHRFDELYPLECTRASEKSEDISLLLLDIDYFKQYNDHLGHLAGDRCLRQIAATLRRTSAGSVKHWAARYGGEEFALVFFGVDAKAAVEAAEAFRQRIEALSIVHQASPLGKVTVSIGVASASSCASYAAQDIFAAADKALYQAKASGRNAVRSFERQTASPQLRCIK